MPKRGQHQQDAIDTSRPKGHEKSRGPLPDERLADDRRRPGDHYAAVGRLFRQSSDPSPTITVHWCPSLAGSQGGLWVLVSPWVLHH